MPEKGRREDTETPRKRGSGRNSSHYKREEPGGGRDTLETGLETEETYGDKEAEREEWRQTGGGISPRRWGVRFSSAQQTTPP